MTDTAKQLIAILEDETDIRRIMQDVLENAGYRTLGFSRATEFEAALRRITPDACLVDLGLPDRDGLALVHRLAMESGAAIIIVSGRAQVQDRVTGLELGADDYIIKPFEPAELLARLRARLRHPAGRSVSDQRSRAAFAGWTADFDRYLLTSPEGAETAMSHAEAEILRIFLDASRRLISRAQMQEALGAAGGESFDRAMDVRISRLRSKLGEDPKNPQLIKTIYGAGYIFLAEVNWV
ncbi:MAG: response regulator transcription factor [Paracoccus denitrificans]|uniref:Response regulator transcription factor n=1 Tax=Paracoccus denitrificans TaxID=266 RepID=A0A533I9E8_PARDE|nr:MAG: response regulator transcription factor [Paracoccus denitrificans]